MSQGTNANQSAVAAKLRTTPSKIKHRRIADRVGVVLRTNNTSQVPTGGITTEATNGPKVIKSSDQDSPGGRFLRSRLHHPATSKNAIHDPLQMNNHFNPVAKM